MKREMVDAVVNWWADKLRGCKNSGLSEEERRDRSNDGYQLAEVLMTATKPKVSDEQIAKFSESLRGQIVASEPYCISVDYGPCEILHKALDAAEINAGMGTLPIKTTMWLEPDGARVRYGYGAEIQSIWPV